MIHPLSHHHYPISGLSLLLYFTPEYLTKKRLPFSSRNYLCSIFTTVDSGLKGWLNNIQLFKVSLADLDATFNAGNSGGFSGFLNGLKSIQNAMRSTITKTDIANIQAYNDQIDACVSPQTAWYRTMQTSSEATKELVESANGGKVALESMSTAASTSKSAIIGLRVATIALNMAITIGLQALISAIQKHRQELEQARSEAISAGEAAASLSDDISELVGEYHSAATKYLVSGYCSIANSEETWRAYLHRVWRICS